jgi:enterochelin esterase-like enzyme
MQIAQDPGIRLENFFISSSHLKRQVIVDFYYPENLSQGSSISLLLINDGQDLSKFNMQKILHTLYSQQEIKPLICAGIHCGPDRKMEYGTAAYPDYKGRGAKAGQHKNFVMDELIPFIQKKFQQDRFYQVGYAGFSLGGLSALDTVWSHPEQFSVAGVFSGSLWWRLRGLDDGYVEERDRIMHKLIREGEYKPGLKFYFTTGSLDEKMDRNHNGIIDSIDDTLGLIDELVQKGYDRKKDICYINYENGRHDVFTWGKAMPHFLTWGWGSDKK